MSPENNKNVYEEFHRNTRALRCIPDEHDFSLWNHLPIYRKYIQAGQMILDIGCGGGPLSIFAASRGARVKGVDLSEKAIAENNKASQYLEMGNLTFACENFMEYHDATVYDVVMMTEVLEHLPDDRRALEKIHDLLAPQGSLLMSVPSVNAPLHKRYVRAFGKDPFDERVGHLRRYNAVAIFNLLWESGFRIVEYRLCEGYLRNWLFNDRVGQFFMKFNRGAVKKIVSFVDEKFFVPLWGESDIIIVAIKR